MTSASGSESTSSGSAAPERIGTLTQEGRSAHAIKLLMGIGLALAVAIAGSSELNAPWMQGDESIFIVRNPDVNPAAAPGEPARPLGTRLGTIITKVHGDLYQPVPIMSYALEWALTGRSAASVRCTDLLLHITNALLLWWVLTALLARTPGAGGRPVAERAAIPAGALAWCLALLWALHPMLVSAYASDMGRTHLLSATFALIALGMYVQAVDRRSGLHFAAALLALLAAMLCKPIPGWVLVALLVEATHRGWRRALLSGRVYAVAVVCVYFAVLAAWTSGQSGMIEDASKGLFGDPAARSALGVWIYARNLLAPLWLAFWYLPDPRTGWGHPLVWAGVGLTIASAGHALWSWRRVRTRAVSLGWAWCWGLLLPVLGLVGAREAAATDRYFYQPLMGMMLVVGVLVSRAIARLGVRCKRVPAPRGTRFSGPSTPAGSEPVPVCNGLPSDADDPRRVRGMLRAAGAAAGVVALAMLMWDLPLGAVLRSNVRRAVHLVRLNPGDPRALEALAVARDYARNHPLPARDLARIPEGTGQFEHFNERFREALEQAAAVAELDRYFPGADDRAAFHRRLAYRFLTAGMPRESLVQAQRAAELEPDRFLTWKRLAHALQALRRFEEAAAAYAGCEAHLPEDATTRAVHYADFGCLLMYELKRDTEACAKFQAAFATGEPPLPAKMGMASCLIRYGEGQDGFELISAVLEADPGNVRAGLILAEYHLRSHHWEHAAAVYDAILRDEPTLYVALRGFHEVCLQTRRYRAAAMAWQDALTRQPERREFRSYLVWALALAQEAEAHAAADELLSADANNPLACLAQAVLALRQDDPPAAIEWVRRAGDGIPIPEARSFARAAATLRLLSGRGELPPASILAEAAIYVVGDLPPASRADVRARLEAFAATPDAEAWAAEIERLLDELKTGESSS